MNQKNQSSDITNDSLKIELGISLALTETSDVGMRLYDMLGRVVLMENTTSILAGDNFKRLNISDLNAGTYFLQINVNGQKTNAIKIVKK